MIAPDEKLLRALREAGFDEVVIAPDGTVTARVAPVRAVDPQMVPPAYIPVPFPCPAPTINPWPWFPPTIVWGTADTQLPNAPAFTSTTVSVGSES